MAANSQDYGETLGVAWTATGDEIRTSNRKLSRQHHSDLNPSDKKAENKFKESQKAYDVLSDEKERKRYDQLGEHWKSGADFQPSPNARCVTP